MNLRKVIAQSGFLALALLVAGCSSLTPRKNIEYFVNYDIGLMEVERPQKATERYGKQAISNQKEGSVSKFLFEDGLVRILWLPTAKQVSFELTNKTKHSIKLIWDDAAFVDTSGESHRVIHQGIKYTAKDSPQPPTTVVHGTTISELIYPADYVTMSKYSYKWNEQDLLLASFTDYGWNSESIPIYQKGVKNYVGKTYKVLLPIQIEDVVNDYLFTFKVNSADITSPSLNEEI